MKYTSLPARLFRCGLLFFIILCQSALWGQPAVLNGTVTSVLTGQPVIGAKISAGMSYTYSVAQGAFALTVDPPGMFPVICTKPGYADFSSPPHNFLPGSVQTLNIQIQEATNPPSGVTAIIDSTLNPPVARISWQVPAGSYEILYDDGIQDNFTVWALHGNMNAVKFTPPGYPARIDGGSVDIGNSSNYPSGSNPFVPFQMAVYDASGPGGTPGSLIGGPVDVIPSVFGWIPFSFSTPVFINSGNFYLVMIQGGNAPNAAGLAVDETTPQFRSYARNIAGGGWIPANGNYMIRAVGNGTGGPLLMLSSPSGLTGYHVWRLRQGEEMNPAVWTDLGSTAALSLDDNLWPLIPCGPYRWAVRSVYTGNRVSPASLSNVIGKCWDVTVRADITLSCTSTSPAGTEVWLENLVYPDSLYYGTADTSGHVWFYHVWKGTYQVKATRFGYDDFVENTGVITDTVIPAFMLQERNPVTGLAVNPKSLVSIWNRPEEVKELFTETWVSGDFAANGWTTPGGVNWIVSNVTGNPAPSAMFTWSPQQSNYNESLISRVINGEHAPVLRLQYDVYLDNFGTTTVNQLAVELWDGTSWLSLRNYSNQSGDINWTTDQVDISAYSASDFRIRFRAYGGNTYDINSWNVDNIRCTGSESPSSPTCVQGYFFYLNNILCGFTEDTTFTIPDNLVQYGNTYSACVVASYGSGYSVPDCYPFTSTYLPPPTNFTGQAIENTAYLTWNKPEMLKKATGGSMPPMGLLGYNLYRDTVLIHFIGDPDSLEYYDRNLYPDTYSYQVSGYYDLTDYGYPGQFDESARAGPVLVDINYGTVLPFYEPWDQGTFDFNGWTFDPGPGNWFMDTGIGNPLPSAGFSSEPRQQDYSFALVSPLLNAGEVSCANIYLDYDLRLVDHNSTQKEMLSVELYYNDTWHLYNNHVNNGNLGWTPFHLNISPVAGKAFLIRFRAHGPDSDNILEWNVDNINVYAVCNPPLGLEGDAFGLDVRLTWSPPQCLPGHYLQEGFEEPYFPPGDWTTRTAGTGNTWHHSGTSDPWGVHSGNWAAAVKSDYNHQDEWLIADDIYVDGNLTFWSYAYQGSPHGDHYLIQISDNNGSSWNTLADLSALPPYPSASGYNEWNDPYNFDLSPYAGEVVMIAWRAYDDNGQGLWYNWVIDDCSVGNKKMKTAGRGSSFLGYDIYRSTGGPGNFTRINGSPVQDTAYTDPGLPPDEYDYFVNAVYEECSANLSSDTVIVDVVTGITPDQEKEIKIYPNPANSVIQIFSTAKIDRIELISSTGTLLLNLNPVINNPALLNISNFPPGVYILRVECYNGLYIRRIEILR